MWSGGISGRNRVRPAGKWAQGLTCQTAKTPACHIQFVTTSFFISSLFFNVIFIVIEIVKLSNVIYQSKYILQNH